MILVTTLTLALRVAFTLTALTLLKDFFNLNKMLKRMSKFFKDEF